MNLSSGTLGAPQEEDVAWPDDAVEVGRIVDAWGIKGWIKVLPFAKDPQALFSSTRWFLKAPEARLGAPKPVVSHEKTPGRSQVFSSPSGGLARSDRSGGSQTYPAWLKVLAVKPQGDVVVAQVRDVPDRNGAEALIGCRVFVPRSSFPTPEPDEYYWTDLIGMAVVNRQGQLLGAVTGLIDTGPHSVLQVQAPEMDERLIPFVAAYVDDVNVAARTITVDWGLDY
ncbi:MAG: ribosome maturation factor RimM [Burkholderiales bacterium]